MLRYALGTHDYPADRVGWSLSHSDGGVAIAVVGENEGQVGVDVEPAVAVERLAEIEADFIDSSERGNNLLQLWTLKEATLKLLGEGIAGPRGLRAMRDLVCTPLPDANGDAWTAYEVARQRSVVAVAWAAEVGAHILAAASSGNRQVPPRLSEVTLG